MVYQLNWDHSLLKEMANKKKEKKNICQAMVYQPNWDHLDEEGGCCMLYMVKVSSSSYMMYICVKIFCLKLK